MNYSSKIVNQGKYQQLDEMNPSILRVTAMHTNDRLLHLKPKRQ